jgi:hypothetical protein
LFDVTREYIMAFVFAGILCFVASASAVVVWGLAKVQQAELQMLSHDQIIKG